MMRLIVLDNEQISTLYKQSKSRII